MIPAHLKFSYLKQAVSIATVLADRGWIFHFKKRGDQIFGPCPVYGGDNPHAFVVSLSKNLWHCFTGCNAGGDVVQLAQRLNRSTYDETAVYLASLVGTSPIPWTPPPSRAPSEKNFRPFTKHLLLDHSVPWLQKKGIQPQTAQSFETGAYHGPGFLADCIGVRLHDLQQRPVGYAGRRMNPHQIMEYGKWKFPRGVPKNNLLFNYHRAKNNMNRGWVVVECPWGVIRLHQLHIPAVALLGVHISSTQHNILSQIPRIILMLDGDLAGRRATTRIQKTLAGYTEVHPIHLPQDQDPDDICDGLLSTWLRYFFPNQSSHRF